MLLGFTRSISRKDRVQEGERALDDHNHATVAVRPLLAEKPCRLSRLDAEYATADTADRINAEDSLTMG